MTPDRPARKFYLRLGRRSFLGGAAMLALGRTAQAEDDEFTDDLRNLRVVDAIEDKRRFTLITPKYLQPDQRIPLIVLLHGLGETGDPKAGAYAWARLYGAGAAWQRMKRPPIERTSKRGEWTDSRLAEVNADLEKRPFRGFAMACPHMPNLSGSSEMDAYASWIEKSLLPRCRRETQTVEDAEHTYLGGVSLGGYVSLEMMMRIPHVFGAWAGVQTAINAAAGAKYAAALAKDPSRPLFLLTSEQDHWRTGSDSLAAGFKEKSLPYEYRVIPGPHDQPWLREAGTIETLYWLDRLRYRMPVR